MKQPSVTLSVFIFALLALTPPCFGASALPDGWWRHESPEQILAKAQSINEQLLFFHGEKLGNTSSALTNPFAKENQTNRTEFFKRRNSDGLIETKNFQLHGDFQTTEFKLRDGNYFLVYGQLIKQEFPEGDEREKEIAAKIDPAYDFKLGEAEMVMTNDCFVIVRTMTEPLLKAATDAFYAKHSEEEKQEYGPKYIRSKVDFYFRKSDGVSLGVMKRNRAGELLEDYVYDKVEVNQPIAEEEFILPKGEVKIVKSFEESLQISRALRRDHRAKSPKKPKAASIEKQSSKLPWAADFSRAIKQAEAENKMVLSDFTGSDWCVWCMKFDEDVLSKPEFAGYAKSNLVMVLLDFPNKKPQSDEAKKANKELRSKYEDPGFPTFVLLNSNGQELGRQTGYLDGGPKAFIEKLESFKKPLGTK